MFAGLAAKFGVYAIAAVVALLAIGGAYWYGKHEGRVETKLAYAEQSLRNAQEARDDEAKLWQAKVKDERLLRQQAEKGRQNATNDITRIKAELARTRAAPIPRSLARMLDDNDGSPGGSDPSSSVGRVATATSDKDRGSAGDYISAAVFYEAIRQNSARYQENIRKLISCNAAYDGIRETLMGMQ